MLVEVEVVEKTTCRVMGNSLKLSPPQTDRDPYLSNPAHRSTDLHPHPVTHTHTPVTYTHTHTPVKLTLIPVFIYLFIYF